jgi:TrmH family RNA methyltransferase
MIVSRQNRKLKDIRRLRRCKDDRALLEGPRLVAEALASRIELETVLVTPDFAADEGSRVLLARLAEPPTEVDPTLFAELGDADAPQGILAVARLPERGVEALPEDAALVLYLDGLQDPGNLGAVARVAEAAGANALALAPGTAHATHPRALRASAGSLLRLPVASRASPEDVADRCPALPWAALATRGGTDLWHAELPARLILALGAEAAGLSPTVAERASLALTIPLAPPVESLNVAVAAGIVLFEIARRRC